MTGTVDLDALAAVWVERWLMHGGALIADLDEARVGMSMSFDNWRWKHGMLHQHQ